MVGLRDYCSVHRTFPTLVHVCDIRQRRISTSFALQKPSLFLVSFDALCNTTQPNSSSIADKTSFRANHPIIQIIYPVAYDCLTMPRPRKRSDNRGRSRAPDDDQSQNSSRRKHGREDDQGSPPPRRQRIGRDSTVSQTSPGNRRASGENIPPAPAKDPPKPDLTRAGQRWTKEEVSVILVIPCMLPHGHMTKPNFRMSTFWHNVR